MALFEDIFPTYDGDPPGKATATRMIASVGGEDTIRTKIQTSSDGTVTRLRTRNGFPDFVVSRAGTIIADDATKGLVTNGVLQKATYLPSGQDNLTTFLDWPDTIDKEQAAAGETYAVENFSLNGRTHKHGLISGIDHWFFGEYLGSQSWVYVPTLNGQCWKVTLTSMTDDLTSFTLSFEAMPTTAKTPPTRSVVQTETVTGATPLQSAATEIRWEVAKARIEDIAPNGNKLIIVNSNPPFPANFNDPTDDGPYSGSKFVTMQGRAVMGAVEIEITGVPPEASVTMTTLYTGAQALGSGRTSGDTATFLPDTGTEIIRSYYEYWEEWSDLLIGVRYVPQVGPGGVITWEQSPVTQTVRKTGTETLVDTSVFAYSNTFFEGESHTAQWQMREKSYAYSQNITVTQEGVTVTLTSNGSPLTPSDSIKPNDAQPVYPYYGVDEDGFLWEPVPPYFEYDIRAQTSSFTGSFGASEFPATGSGSGTTVDDGLLLTNTSGYGVEYFSNSLAQLLGIKHLRPAWRLDANISSTGADGEITQATVGEDEGYGAVLAVKYANRLFGLQAVIFGQPSPGGAANNTRGPGIIYPACIGVGDTGSATPIYSTIASGIVPPRASQVTETIEYGDYTSASTRTADEYPTKNNTRLLLSSGTARYSNPKAVVDKENVVFAHYK